jgi:NTP pyrophosphatase (non-canonical NTP hydrolase)
VAGIPIDGDDMEPTEEQIERWKRLATNRGTISFDEYGMRKAVDLLNETSAALEEVVAALEAASSLPAAVDGYQSRVFKWMMACFNDEIAFSRKERNHRFLEEALELVQAMGCTRSEANQLVDYVFDRPIGEPKQEVGGVIVCLAALCTAAEIDMDAAGETELARIWTKVEKIRAKHAAKPQFSPLPGPSAPNGSAAS